VRLRITVEGKAYDVDVEVMDEPQPEEERVAIPASVLQPRPIHILPEDKIVRSPIAGLITSVIAEAGQVVLKDETLLIIEAMKMESKLGAPMGGVVKNVQVAPGQTVRAGQVLVELA